MKPRSIQIISLVCIWYVSSMGLTFLNRSLGQEYHMPLYITSIHMCIHGILAHLITKQRPTWPEWRVYPTAISTAGDIGASNMALVSVKVGFYTIVKSSVPLFVLVFAILFGLEKLSAKLCVMIVIITTGIIMSVWKNTDFEPDGFMLLLIAVTLSGLRWSLTTILMARMKSPLHAMRHLSPVMSIFIFVVALIVNPVSTLKVPEDFSLFKISALTIFGSILAFALTLSEFRLLQISSVLTVSIFGIIKEILTIILDIFIEGQSLSVLNVFGLIICISGILWYHIWRTHSDEDAREAYSPVRDIFFNDDLEVNYKSPSSPRKRNSLKGGISPTSPMKSPTGITILKDVNAAFGVYECQDIEMNDATTSFIKTSDDES